MNLRRPPNGLKSRVFAVKSTVSAKSPVCTIDANSLAEPTILHDRMSAPTCITLWELRHLPAWMSVWQLLDRSAPQKWSELLSAHATPPLTSSVKTRWPVSSLTDGGNSQTDAGKSRTTERKRVRRNCVGPTEIPRGLTGHSVVHHTASQRHRTLMYGPENAVYSSSGNTPIYIRLSLSLSVCRSVRPFYLMYDTNRLHSRGRLIEGQRGNDKRGREFVSTRGGEIRC